MPLLDYVQFSDFLAEHAREGRDVQLYGVHGQTIFPLWAENGALRTDAAVFPILRGQGGKAPKFEGAFPMKDGGTIDLGNGWIAMCVIFGYYQTLAEKIAKLEAAEEKLRAMKSGIQGGN